MKTVKQNTDIPLIFTTFPKKLNLPRIETDPV